MSILRDWSASICDIAIRRITERTIGINNAHSLGEDLGIDDLQHLQQSLVDTGETAVVTIRIEDLSVTLESTFRDLYVDVATNSDPDF